MKAISPLPTIPYPMRMPLVLFLSMIIDGNPHPQILLNTATVKIATKKTKSSSCIWLMLTCAPINAKNNGATSTFNLPTNSLTCSTNFDPAKPIPAAKAPTIGLRPTLDAIAAKPNAEAKAAPCFVALASSEDGFAAAMPETIFGSKNTAPSKIKNQIPIEADHG